MFRKYRMWIILTCAATLLPIVIGLLTWNALPASMATNFGADGEANGWSSRYFAVFALPCIILALHLLCVFSTLGESRKNTLSSKIILLIFWICPAVSWFCAVVIYANALGIPIGVLNAVKIFMGVLFIVLGNYLPKCRQNHVIGIKLPWTLSDAEIWNKTHRLAGCLYVLLGFLWIISIFAGNVILPLTGCFIIAIIPTVYSIILYLRS